jgi:hypothetical protein
VAELTDNSTSMMDSQIITSRTRFEILPISDSDLSDVAQFLSAHTDQGTGQLERYLQWLLMETPFTGDGEPRGLCIRDHDGGIVGTDLWFPGVFLVGDRRLRGLGAGKFFVEPQARTLGFYLFKRSTNVPDYEFFFSTSCNAQSAALWKTLGAVAVPDSDREYVLPLRLDVMLPAWLASGGSRTLATAVAWGVGRCANHVVQSLVPKSSSLRIEPCRDWEKLADLFGRHRSPAWITTDRSAAFLQWRYGPHAQNHPFEICSFRDSRGHEGWFALGTLTRGRDQEIRGCVLLDAVWPRKTMRFADILPVIVQQGVAADADALFLPGRSSIDYGHCSRWLIPRKLDAPAAFAMPQKHSASLELCRLDLVPADGDGAF